jgi:hypothetical protein
MIKALIKLAIEGMYLNIIKAVYKQPVSNIRLSGGKTETLSSEVRNETRVSTFSTLIGQSLGVPSQSNKTGRRNKRNSNRNERSQIVNICR